MIESFHGHCLSDRQFVYPSCITNYEPLKALTSLDSAHSEIGQQLLDFLDNWIEGIGPNFDTRFRQLLPHLFKNIFPGLAV